MRRLISVLLALAMILAAVPAVFAAEAVSIDEAIVAELTEANGYEAIHYWTIPEDGTIEGIYAMVGEDFVDSSYIVLVNDVEHNTIDAENPIHVEAGDEVEVVVLGEEEATVTVTATYLKLAGTKDNPIYPEFVWNDAYTEATVTVTAPVGTTYYAVYGGGMLLSINGGEPALLVASGIGRAPAVFTITNNGAAAAEYSLKLTYPVGNMSNPAVLVMGENVAQIEAGNNQGYYYTWTAPTDGTLSITMPEDGWTYTINNLTTYAYGEAQMSNSDPVANPGTVAVSAGNEIQLIVNVYDAKNPYNYPGGTLEINAAFEAAFDDTLTIPQANELGVSKEHNTYTEEMYYVTGKVTAVASTTWGNMYIADEDGNTLYVYGTYDAEGNRYDAMETKPTAGDTVTLYGVIGQFNGTAQIKNAVVTELIPGEGEESTDPEADSTLTIAEAIALGESKLSNVYTEGKYYVTGLITEVYNTQYGNMYITDEAGNILTLYGTYNADGSVDYSAMDVKPVAGDTITIYGVIGQYNSKAQIKNGWIVEHTPADISVAMIGDVKYETVKEALNAAVSGDTVTLTADANEPNANLTIDEGVTLDLAGYDLTAKSLNGLSGSYLNATRYGNEGHGRLFVAKNRLSLTDAVINGQNKVIPYWDPADGCYVLANTRIKDIDGALIIDEEAKTISFKFSYGAGGAANADFLSDGAEDNALTFVVRLEWESENGIAYQDFVYKNEYVSALANSGGNFTFGLTGYNALGIDLSTFSIQGMILSDSGIIVSGDVYTA